MRAVEESDRVIDAQPSNPGFMALACIIGALFAVGFDLLSVVIILVFVDVLFWLQFCLESHAGRLELGALDSDTTALLSKYTGGTFRRTWGGRRFLDGGHLRHADLLHVLELERQEQERLAEVYRARQRAEAAYADHVVAGMEASADAIVAFHARAAALAREAAAHAPHTSSPCNHRRSDNER